MNPEYLIYAVDSLGERTGQIDDFRKLDMVLRFNRVSNWILELPYGAKSRLVNWKGGIEVVRDEEIILSGLLMSRQREDSGQQVVTLAGTDKLGWFKVDDDQGVLCYPCAYPFTGQAYDSQSGPAETVIKHYVDSNAGLGAGIRAVPGLTIESDSARGSTVSASARLEVLLDLIRSLAETGRIGFRIRGSEFEVFEPSDLSGSVIFSKELGTMVSYKTYEERAKANFILCGGPGEGTSRTFLTDSDNESMVRYGRVEMWLDEGKTSDSDELQQAVDEALTENAGSQTVSFTPLETSQTRFKSDYDLGDIVTVVTDEFTIQDRVRAVQISLTAEGESIQPVVGSDNTLSFNPLARTLQKITRTSGRVSQMEKE